MKNKILLFEFWGLGDAVMATSAIQRLQAKGCQVSLICKPISAQLLRPSYPEIEFYEWVAPWTKFSGKYKFWTWNWVEIKQAIRWVKQQKFDCALSARPDPRDVLFMLFCKIRQRMAIPHAKFRWLLQSPWKSLVEKPHRVDNWHILLDTLPHVKKSPYYEPKLKPESIENKQRVLIHCGASSPIRRLKITQWEEVITVLKSCHPDLSIDIACDLDGFGRELENQANFIYQPNSINELLELLANYELVVGNDSGPGHIAAALGAYTLTIFGPQIPEKFYPYSKKAQWIAGEECSYKPCKDSCHFEKPHCIENISSKKIANKIIKLLN